MKIYISLDKEQVKLIADLVRAVVSNIDLNKRNPGDKFEKARFAMRSIMFGKPVDVLDLNGLLDTIGGAYAAAEEAVKLRISAPSEIQDFVECMKVAGLICEQMQKQGAIAPVRSGE